LLELFLELNGFTLVADDAQCVIVILSLAAGPFSEDELAEWIRRHLKPA
jgi:death-on-curing protein